MVHVVPRGKVHSYCFRMIHDIPEETVKAFVDCLELTIILAVTIGSQVGFVNTYRSMFY